MGYRDIVPKDVVHRLGQPRAGLLRLIVHAGMTWNIQTRTQFIHQLKQKTDFRQQRVSRSKKKREKKGRQLQKINTNYLKWKQAIYYNLSER